MFGCQASHREQELNLSGNQVARIATAPLLRHVGNVDSSQHLEASGLRERFMASPLDGWVPLWSRMNIVRLAIRV